MNAVSFDTLAVVRRLKAAGFSEDQAEAVTGVLQEASRIDLSDLATRADLANFATKADLLPFVTKTDLSNFVTGTELRAELSDAKYDILKSVLSAIGFQTIVVVGAIVALSKGVH